MAQDFSFDAVSEVDLNLVAESIQVAMKEIINRFDFKGANASIELDAKAKKIIVRASDPMRVNSVLDILFLRMAKRSLPLKNFEKGEIETALGQTARMEVVVQSGIPTDKAKEMAKRIERVLTNDPGMGILRHVDAGYDIAKQVAKKKKVKIPMMGT